MNKLLNVSYVPYSTDSMGTTSEYSKLESTAINSIRISGGGCGSRCGSSCSGCGGGCGGGGKCSGGGCGGSGH